MTMFVQHQLGPLIEPIKPPDQNRQQATSYSEIFESFM